MSEYLFTSKRLGFRQWKESDLDPYFYAINSDEKVMEFYPSTLTRKESDEQAERITSNIHQDGFGLYAVDLLSKKEFIGYIGFSKPRFNMPFTPCIEIGWRLKKDVWGNGLATEGAIQCLNHGFSALAFDKIYSFAAIQNKPSQRVMQKIGMTYLGTFNHPKLPGHVLEEHVLYCIQNKKGTT